MLDFKRRFTYLVRRGRYSISRRVHDRRVQTRLQVGIALALGVGLLVSSFLFTGLLSSFHTHLSDFLYQPIAPTGQVVLVAIDDASLAKVGPWPWSQATLVSLLNAIRDEDPRAVALDVLVADAEGGQTSLAQAVERVPNLVLPVVGVNAVQTANSVDSLPRFNLVLGPSANLLEKGVVYGHTMIMPDPDGVVRRVPVVIQASAHEYDALGIAAYNLAEHRAAPVEIAGRRARVGSRVVPLDAQGRMYVKFTSPASRTVVSAADLIQSRADPERLRGKIVLIGPLSSSLSESFDTPLSIGSYRVYPVEIEADLVETLVGNRPLADQEQLNQVAMLFLMALLAGTTLPHVRWLSAAALAILYFLAYLVYAFGQFANGILVQPLYPGLALLLTFVCTMVYRHFAEERPRAFVGRLFRRHVGPEGVDRVLSAFDHGELPVHGVRREVTVLYVDLREFTALTHSLTPEAAIDLLNEYVSEIAETTFGHSGSVVKQLGSTMVAVWNLPLNQIDHASSAISAAVEIRERVKQLNTKRPRELALSVGIGVATGSVIAGRIGAPGTAEYTIVGEIVNIAQRLAARRDGTVFLNAAAHEQGGSGFETRQLNPMRLRRKTDPVVVFEVVEPMELEPVEESETEIEPA